MAGKTKKAQRPGPNSSPKAPPVEALPALAACHLEIERRLQPEVLVRILETLKEGVCITNKDGVILYLNRRHAQLSCMEYDAMLGHCVLEFVPSKMDIVLNPQVIETGEQVTCVQSLPDGRRIIMEGNPIKNDDGKTVYCVTYSRDVTVMADISQRMLMMRNLLEPHQAVPPGDQDKGPAHMPPRLFSSGFLRKMYGRVSSIAETDAPILLLGETGVGKDVFARCIHEISGRKEHRFVKIDCGSIPENLIETELFGYEGGTFSGASKGGKMGLIEAAAGGTLYLDEVGELPLVMQSRLLRFLQDREIVRVGSVAPRKIDVRVIAATNRDLELAVGRGEFRKDLYYRLCVVVLRIPPLRERQEDILPLARMFLRYYNTSYHRSLTLSEEAERMLHDYDWPGNVRELENMIQGLVVLYRDSVISAAELPFATREAASLTPEIEFAGRTYKDVLRDMEAQLLSAALRRYGSLTEVARNMHVDRSTLFRKVRELEKRGISLPRLPDARA